MSMMWEFVIPSTLVIGRSCEKGKYMSSERKPDKTAPGRTQASEHGRFAQTLRRFRSRPTNGEPPPALQGPPPRTASAGTRRPVARSADAVQPPAPSKAASARKSAPAPRSESLIPAPELLAPRRSAKPPEPEPPAPNMPDDEPTQTWVLRWRWTPMIIGVAVLCWIVALSLLFTGSSPVAPRLSSPRLTFVVVWVIASLFTFVPLEFRLGLPGLTVQGVTGWTFLGYILAFAPPPAGPSGWLVVRFARSAGISVVLSGAVLCCFCGCASADRDRRSARLGPTPAATGHAPRPTTSL